jgi:hypothetical protein
MTSLIKKYVIILIIYELYIRYGLKIIIDTSLDFYPIHELSNLNDYINLFYGAGTLIANLTIGAILIRELDRSQIISWLLFVLTLFQPLAGVLFSLFWLWTKKKSVA